VNQNRLCQRPRWTHKTQNLLSVALPAEGTAHSHRRFRHSVPMEMLITSEYPPKWNVRFISLVDMIMANFVISLFLSPGGDWKPPLPQEASKLKLPSLSTPNVTHPLQAALPQSKHREGVSVRMVTTWHSRRMRRHPPPRPPFFPPFFRYFFWQGTQKGNSSTQQTYNEEEHSFFRQCMSGVFHLGFYPSVPDRHLPEA
jgi:hypothetical protein